MMSERLFNSFIPPQNCYTPKQISGYAPANYTTLSLINTNAARLGTDWCILSMWPAYLRESETLAVKTT